MANGGIIGPVNITSRGKNTLTTKTSSGDVTTQPGTRVVKAVIVAGGAGGGSPAGLPAGLPPNIANMARGMDPAMLQGLM